MVVELRTPAEFEKEIDFLTERVKECIKRGSNRHDILYYLIGSITAFAGKENERVFTEAELRKIFDLAALAES